MSFNNSSRLQSYAYAETHTWYRYDKVFAYFPTVCIDSRWVWRKYYYKKYLVFSYTEIDDVSYYQYRLTAEDCIIEKLAEDH
jgi:hypothetical protein